MISVDEALIGILTLCFGPIVAWISTFILYGFGELIDKTCDIEQKISIRNTETSSKIDQNISISNTETSSKEVSKSVEASQSNIKPSTITKCDFCDSENVEGAFCEITDYYGTRYRNLCYNCIEKNKDKISVEYNRK